jgi:hypothetical protein
MEQETFWTFICKEGMPNFDIGADGKGEGFRQLAGRDLPDTGYGAAAPY